MPPFHQAKNLSSPSVVGAGLIVLDIVVSSDSDRLSPYAGGTCGNVLSILSFLGWNAYPIARLNGDAASLRVKADFERWGVHLDFAECEPTVETPIIVQVIQRNGQGAGQHHFAWYCPVCGHELPRYKPISVSSVESCVAAMGEPAVFFMDRVSQASLMLARTAAERGALVVFEPSGKTHNRLFEDALDTAHVVKYSEERFPALHGTLEGRRMKCLEIQTLGARGLRYRNWLAGKKSQTKWADLPGFHRADVVDTCGAGDWTTAGFISKACSNGLEGLLASSRDDLESALRYGQALASWNCGFEGARGGMYQTDKSVFHKQIRQVLEGDSVRCSEEIAKRQNDLRASGNICPGCKVTPSQPMVRTGRRRANIPSNQNIR